MDHGIIQSSEMVRAFLEGRKSQIIVPFIKAMEVKVGDKVDRTLADFVCRARKTGWVPWWGQGDQEQNERFTVRLYKNGFPCPLGEPGDHIYVRETFYMPCSGGFDESGEFNPYEIKDRNLIKYAATDEPVDRGWKEKPYRHALAKRSSSCMPKSAARIWRINEGVTVKRWFGLTENDAKNEGISESECAECLFSYLSAFRAKWDKHYPKYPSSTNPWVFVIKLREAHE